MTQGALTVRVVRKATEALDICTFELEHVAGQPLPAFSAGSHVDVHVPGGHVRQYSLCNDPRQSQRYQIAVLREPHSRGGSTAMHDTVREGDVLEISEPRNHFPLAHGARHSLLLAGGIGITPILCMAERLAHAGMAFDLHYCTRSRARTAFLDRIAQSTFAPRVSFHFDDEDSGQRLNMSAVLATPHEDTHLYVCGPTGFMDAVIGTAKQQGWGDDRVHREYFSAAPKATDTDAAFEVRIASSGRVVNVPKDRTVVQALAEAGIEVMTSCEQGVCGTCLTRVLEGEPDHRDSYLTEDERAQNDQFTPCCSRASSPVLVLDL